MNEIRKEQAKRAAANPLTVRWYVPAGYYVRVETRTGYVRGFLTDRGGVGGIHLAKAYSDPDSAAMAAAEKGFRAYTVCRVAPATSPTEPNK